MASLTDAKKIIDDAGVLLNDAGAIHWTKTELLSWLNAGQLELATLVPNANNETVTIQLVAGAKQSAPIDNIRIIDFVRNMGTSGTTPGNAIRQIERKVMDAYVPGWSGSAANAVVQHAMYDAEDNNMVFYVYPPQPISGFGWIELIYSQIPETIPDSIAGTKITVADFYVNALLDYVLYRAFAKDSEAANQAQRSKDHYQNFLQAVGAKFGVDMTANDKSKKG